jgi:leucine dehydrogenase
MSVFGSSAFDGHEQVVFGHDRQSGLRAIIAIHNTRLGPAVGGCRMLPYDSDDTALTDVLRLSRGMTHKSALAGLPFGGGKSVIIGNPRYDKTPELMQAMGRLIDSLGGRYIAAEDVGTNVADMDAIACATRHVAGTSATTGNPSPQTAYGVYQGILAAIAFRTRSNHGLEDVEVAIQGLGAVGFALAHLLSAAGARLHVADISDEAVDRAVGELGATPVDTHEIHTIGADVFAPCALGGAINDRTIEELRAGIVAGSANNQLAEDRLGAELAARGILYAPDYVINAGGIIDIAYGAHMPAPYDKATVRRHIERIHDTLTEIFTRAEAERAATNVIADQMAEERLQAAA